jgi:hypothetical protein
METKKRARANALLSAGGTKKVGITLQLTTPSVKAEKVEKAARTAKAVDEEMAKEEVEVQVFTMAVEVEAKETMNGSMGIAVDVANMVTRQWIAE